MQQLQKGKGDVRLWRAVIAQQITDALIVPIPGTKSFTENERLRNSARYWLLENGPDFDLACHYADIGPGQLRFKLRDFLSQIDAGQINISEIMRRIPEVTSSPITQYEMPEGFDDEISL